MYKLERNEKIDCENNCVGEVEISTNSQHFTQFPVEKNAFVLSFFLSIVK